MEASDLLLAPVIDDGSSSEMCESLGEELSDDADDDENVEFGSTTDGESCGDDSAEPIAVLILAIEMEGVVGCTDGVAVNVDGACPIAEEDAANEPDDDDDADDVEDVTGTPLGVAMELDELLEDEDDVALVLVALVAVAMASDDGDTDRARSAAPPADALVVNVP